MANSQITVVIPYYKSPASLQKLVIELGKDFPIVVVNNGSILPNLPKSNNVRTIVNIRNDGFAHAANQGAAVAKSDLLLFLNPDVFISVVQARQLLKFLQTEKLSAVSPTLIDTAGQIQRGYHQPLPTFFRIMQMYSPLRVVPERQFGKTVLPGAALLIRRIVLEELFGWDERFWLWWEDSDLSMRMEQKGYTFAVASDIRVQHIGGETFKPLNDEWKRQVFFHSLRLFARKHFSDWQSAAITRLTSRFSANALYPPDQEIRASVVVPNMKRELLIVFLQENLKTILPTDELIVVTSAGDIAKLRLEYPEVIFVPIEKNFGFAHTVNIGLRRARGKYLFTVNDDTILPPDWIGDMIAVVGDRTGSVSPKIESPAGDIESLGVDVLPSGKARSRTSVLPTKPDAFNGAAVLLTRPALERVGLFDESFESYLEDIDLGLRMKAGGFQHQVAESVRVVHERHATSSSRPIYKTWLDAKNWWFIVMKPYFWRNWSNPASVLLERGRNFSGLLKAVWKATLP